MAYRHQFGTISAGFRANYTRVLQRDDFTDPTDATFADRVLSEAGTPKDRLTANAEATLGKFTFGYQFRWVGKQVFGAAENTYSVNGEDPQNPDYSDPRFYGNVFYHDIRGEYAVDEKFLLLWRRGQPDEPLRSVRLHRHRRQLGQCRQHRPVRE